MKTITAHTITIVSLVLALFLSGCSYQWREADPGITDDELIDLIAEIGKNASVSSGTGNMQKFMSIVENPNSTIFFAEGFVDNSGTMGPPAAILSLLDFYFMGREDITVWDLSEARAIFLDLIDDSGVRQNALLLDMQVTGESNFVTKVFVDTGDAAVIEDEFSVTLKGEGAGAALVARSYDLVEGSDELAGVIQLQLWDFNDQGEDYLGKISTMVGFD
ncbi:MAG: hypothetical protein H6624_08225 [Bdellovibrionaceae bacterium]|nr:hypothetical protein [Bdellovibrionales bacterium]MCB9084318.1 hypothetical protein [Pseudobdellovibrionaceae bacterium]